MFLKIRQWMALPAWQRRIFLQAFFMLGWARYAITHQSLKSLTASLEHASEPPPVPKASESQMREAHIIGQLVQSAAKYTPWKSKCLVQVLVVQRLMARRRIGGQFYLGARRDTGVDVIRGEDLVAHAWLRCGHYIVSGEEGHQQFTVLSAFSWGGND